MRKMVIAMIKLYQYISYGMPQRCRFYPTCSEYSIQAIRKYGVLKGLYKSILRILRCNPFFKGGYDPLR